jgi:hypothetical protein
MRNRQRRIARVLGALAVTAALGLSPGQARAGGFRIGSVSAGLGFENFSRTVVWKGDTSSSKIRANLFTARADLGFGRGTVVSFSAGLSLAGFRGLTFSSLPISLELGSPTLRGMTLGLEALTPIAKFQDFEISGTGRVVYSFGLSKTWALTDFAVPGTAKGKASWLEAAAGPRLSYVFFGRIVPYLEVWARWFRAAFDMTETLADLGGSQGRRVRGDLSLSAALGADAKVSDRVTVKAKLAILPFAGGVDGLAAIGIAYKF